MLSVQKAFLFSTTTNTFVYVSTERLHILPFLQQSVNAVLIDVRSPSEYNHAHLPGAASLPLFSDEERSVVGTAYKQQSRQQAIKEGLDFFGPKMRKMVETVEALAAEKATKQVFVYCWRGGMRSGAVAWLLDLYGFPVFVLQGGYKSFRQYVLQTFSKPFVFKIIGGYTGSGKTELLKELSNHGEQIIDLEGLAVHKGSAFGNIDMPPQPSQEMFENILATQLNHILQHHPAHTTIWLEDESQRIGHINLPMDLWNTMRASPVLFLEIPFEERLQHLVEEYGGLDRERMISAIERISKRLGPLETKKAIQLLKEENISESFRILLTYYDKHYLKGLHNRENLPGILNKISCASVSTNNVQFLLSKPMIA